MLLSGKLTPGFPWPWLLAGGDKTRGVATECYRRVAPPGISPKATACFWQHALFTTTHHPTVTGSQHFQTYVFIGFESQDELRSTLTKYKAKILTRNISHQIQILLFLKSWRRLCKNHWNSLSKYNAQEIHTFRWRTVRHLLISNFLNFWFIYIRQ